MVETTDDTETSRHKPKESFIRQGYRITFFDVRTNTGKAKQVEVQRSDNKLSSDEAASIFRGMGKWTPACVNNQPVEVAYVFPVTFKLN